jgi:hypothetical protein
MTRTWFPFAVLGLFVVPACSNGRASSASGVGGGGAALSSSGVGGDDPGLVPASAWTAGALPLPLPSVAALLSLPGGGVGRPLFASSSPLAFEGDGLLYGTGRPSPTRGGEAYPLEGDFGVWFRHVNQSKSGKFVSLLVRNASMDGISVAAEGSGYTQLEAGGLGLQASPDYLVARDWIRGELRTTLEGAALAPGQPSILWQKFLAPGTELDGRFVVHASGAVHAFVVVTSNPTLAEVHAATELDAPGPLASPATPPSSFGTTAGVYAKDTWAGDLRLEVPAASHNLGFVLNSATGTAHPQIQAFSALSHYDDSAQEAVGMHGVVYDLAVRLVHDGADDAPRHVRLALGSVLDPALSRDWDGLAIVDGTPVPVTITPKSRLAPLAELTVARGESRTVRLRAMVPGMATYPAGLFLESR